LFFFGKKGVVLNEQDHPDFDKQFQDASTNVALPPPAKSSLNANDFMTQLLQGETPLQFPAQKRYEADQKRHEQEARKRNEEEAEQKRYEEQQKRYQELLDAMAGQQQMDDDQPPQQQQVDYQQMSTEELVDSLAGDLEEIERERQLAQEEREARVNNLRATLNDEFPIDNLADWML
jgi:hypothetical protein